MGRGIRMQLSSCCGWNPSCTWINPQQAVDVLDLVTGHIWLVHSMFGFTYQGPIIIVDSLTQKMYECHVISCCLYNSLLFAYTYTYRVYIYTYRMISHTDACHIYISYIITNDPGWLMIFLMAKPTSSQGKEQEKDPWRNQDLGSTVACWVPAGILEWYGWMGG